MALTLLVSAACGGSSSLGASSATTAQSPPNVELISSGTATRAAGSARVAMLVTLSSGSTTVMTMKGAGVVGFEPSAAAMSLRISGDKSLGLIDGMVMRELLVDGATYIQSPLFAGISGSGKQWVKVDLGALGTDAGPAGVGSSQSDPALMLDYLRGVTSSISEVGTDAIRGERTTRYHGEMSMQKAFAKLPADQRKRLQAALDAMPERTPIDVWVDDDGRVRRIEVAIDMIASGQKVTSTARVDYYDFGVHVDLKAPPASQVTDLGGLGAAVSGA